MRSSSRRRHGIVALLAVLLAATAAGLITSKRTSAREPAFPLTVGSIPTGRPIPSGFLGLSLEYTAILPYAGRNPRAVDPVFVQLVRNLTPGQRPVLRIGGDTTDWTWWPVPGEIKPGGISYALGKRWLRVTSALARALDARLILGINLELDSPTDAAAEAHALVRGIGRRSIEALELGNEPELYGSFSWYRLANGHQVTGRAAGYDFADFERDYSRISRSLPHLPLAGPATGEPSWITRLGQFLPAEPRVTIATVHRYPLKLCRAPAASPTYPSIPRLLATAASQGLAATLGPPVRAAHARHDSLRVDELNSVSCGGAPGVSNVFASALWALDATFQMARVGVDGVNFHTLPGAPYQLFRFSRRDGRWQAFVEPDYYGLLMFAQAAPAGSRLLPVTGALGKVRAWAARAPDGVVHVVLINDYAPARNVAVRIAGMRSRAALLRLRAPSIAARAGVTLGGLSFGARTTTGRLAGRAAIVTVKRDDGAYVVRLPPASAAMLTLAPSRK